jgi:hypothetical protein
VCVCRYFRGPPGGGTCTETINDPAVDCVDLKKSVCQACEGGGCLYNNNEKFCYGRDSGDNACHAEVFVVGKHTNPGDL